jgi:hypothetical protein
MAAYVPPKLNLIPLGNVDSIDVSKSSNLIPLTYFGSGSDNTELYDMFGATRLITIIGSWAGEIAAIRTVVGNFDNMLNGQQLKTYKLETEELGDGTGIAGYLSVKIVSFNYTWVLPGNRVKYNIVLHQGREEL